MKGLIYQAAEKVDQESRYDRVIHCPGCGGSGFSMNVGECSDHAAGLDAESAAFDDWKKVACRFCMGTGIAYAWYESFKSGPTLCEACHGLGQHLSPLPHASLQEPFFVDCEACHGEGLLMDHEDIRVHVTTLSGRGMTFPDIEAESIEEFQMDFRAGALPCRFTVEINEDNADLLNSRPRQQPLKTEPDWLDTVCFWFSAHKSKGQAPVQA
jgi:DnaJ-class molecular chaperone